MMKINNLLKKSVFSLSLLVFMMTLIACKEVSLDVQDIVETAGSISRHVSNMGEKTDAEEVVIGKEVSATLLGAFPLSNNREKQLYINRVGVWLALQTNRTGLNWRFAVLDVQNINAFASPGGYIFVTRGLLDILDNEAQLAGVLSHEIAHVIERHHMNELQSNASFGIANDLSQFALRQSSGGDSLKTQYLSDEVSKKLMVAAKSLYSNGLAKTDEFSADHLGMLISAKAGYDPYAYLEVLHKLDKYSTDDSQLALLFKTHPKPSERLSHLDTLIQSSALNAADDKLLTNRFMKYGM
ncbi:MAG: M48 family metalloprotease [Gammaproteobacteria bacterium]|nr:M48 family metalloprotease [Gammaproteobacteria bacterium]